MVIDKLNLTHNRSRITAYNGDEYTALEIMSSLQNKTNEVIVELNNKMSNGGNFTGSWHGIERPELADVGISGQVGKNRENIEKITVILTDFKHYVVGNDWSLALKKAVENIKDGGTLLIPSGSYEVETFLNFEEDWTKRNKNRHFNIVGHGTSSILKVKKGAEYGLFINHSVSLNLINSSQIGENCLEDGIIKLSNFAIDCNNEKNGIRLSSTFGIKIDNLSIYNINSDVLDENSGGIYIEGAGAYTMSNLFIRGSKNSVGININEGAGDGNITGCHISGGAYNILFKNSTGNQRIFNNLFQYSTISNILTKGDLYDNSKFNIFMNLFETYKGSTLSLNENSIKCFNDGFIYNNIIWLHGNNLSNGVIMGYCERVDISNNKFMEINRPINGKCIKTNGNYHNIENNVINNIGDLGIGIDINSDNSTIKGNKVVNGSSKSIFLQLNNVNLCKIYGNKTYGLFNGKGLKGVGSTHFDSFKNELVNSDFENIDECYNNKGILKSDVDLNSIKKIGYYYLQGTTINTPNNTPIYGILEVIPSFDYIKQIITTSDNKLIVRFSTNSGNSWNSWREV